jgi:integrase
VYGVLAPLRQAAGGVDAVGRVWGAIREIDTPYRTALTRAKILDPDVTFHTLRHTFASHYVMRGGRLEKLQEILGHSTIKTTEIYKHLAADYLTGATALLEGLGTEINAPSTHEAGAPSERPAGVS